MKMLKAQIQAAQELKFAESSTKWCEENHIDYDELTAFLDNAIEGYEERKKEGKKKPLFGLLGYIFQLGFMYHKVHGDKPKKKGW